MRKGKSLIGGSMTKRPDLEGAYASPLLRSVRAAVLQECSDYPALVPIKLRAVPNGSRIQTRVADPETAKLKASPRDRMHRYAGARDVLLLRRVVSKRIGKTVRDHQPHASDADIRKLLHPRNRADLVQACVYRYAPLIGPDADLTRIYRDAHGRTVLDDQYAGHVYDADHCAGEITERALDCTLVDWMRFLEELRTICPQMFIAVWHRDVTKAEAILGQLGPERLPQLRCLRSQKDPIQKFRFMVGLWAEFERLFELLEEFGGPERVTESSLRAFLASTADGAAAAGLGSRAALYVSTAWCHVRALTELQQNGCAPALEQSHPYKAFATNGFAPTVDELAAVRTDSGRKVAAKSIYAAVPFAQDSRLRPITGDLPAHFFVGRDTRTLAIRFILEIRKEMGPFYGRRANRGKRHPYFEFETSGAIGRLAMIITHRICPGTVSAVLAESYVNLLRHNRQLPPLAPGDMVANPVAWVRLYSGSRARPSTVAARATAIHKSGAKTYLFSNIVEAARKDENDLLSQCAGGFGYSVKFSALQWFSPYAEADQLARQWKKADPDLKSKLPALFAPVSAGDLKFCSRVAARMLPSALPIWQDPHWRKPDKLRGKL
jgi:hypothetical protein